MDIEFTVKFELGFEEDTTAGPQDMLDALLSSADIYGDVEDMIGQRPKWIAARVVES